MRGHIINVHLDLWANRPLGVTTNRQRSDGATYSWQPTVGIRIQTVAYSGRGGAKFFASPFSFRTAPFIPTSQRTPSFQCKSIKILELYTNTFYHIYPLFIIVINIPWHSEMRVCKMCKGDEAGPLRYPLFKILSTGLDPDDVTFWVSEWISQSLSALSQLGKGWLIEKQLILKKVSRERNFTAIKSYQNKKKYKLHL